MLRCQTMDMTTTREIRPRRGFRRTNSPAMSIADNIQPRRDFFFFFACSHSLGLLFPFFLVYYRWARCSASFLDPYHLFQNPFIHGYGFIVAALTSNRQSFSNIISSFPANLSQTTSPYFTPTRDYHLIYNFRHVFWLRTQTAASEQLPLARWWDRHRIWI